MKAIQPARGCGPLWSIHGSEDTMNSKPIPMIRKEPGGTISLLVIRGEDVDSFRDRFVSGDRVTHLIEDFPRVTLIEWAEIYSDSSIFYRVHP